MESIHKARQKPYIVERYEVHTLRRNSQKRLNWHEMFKKDLSRIRKNINKLQQKYYTLKLILTDSKSRIKTVKNQ